MFNELDISNWLTAGSRDITVILLIVGLSAWAFTIGFKLVKEMVFK